MTAGKSLTITIESTESYRADLRHVFLLSRKRKQFSCEPLPAARRHLLSCDGWASADLSPIAVKRDLERSGVGRLRHFFGRPGDNHNINKRHPHTHVEAADTHTPSYLGPLPASASAPASPGAKEGFFSREKGEGSNLHQLAISPDLGFPRHRTDHPKLVGVSTRRHTGSHTHTTSI